MKILVTSEFYDKYHTSTLYKVGAVLDFDDERANDIISKGLAKPYAEPEEKKKGRPKAEPKPEVKPEPKESPEPKTKAEEKAE